MMDVVRFVLWLVARVLRLRAALVAENALLRQQLIAAQRSNRPTADVLTGAIVDVARRDSITQSPPPIGMTTEGLA